MFERALLSPLSLSFPVKQDKSSYGVRKDNTLRYKGSSYTLPEGTYKGHDTTVFVQQEDDHLNIWDSGHVQIAHHPVSLLKGELVRNNNHYRDNTTKVTELISQVSQLFTDTEKATTYLEKIRCKYPRYVRDQVKLIARLCKQHPKEVMDRALHYCMENDICRATDFEPVLLSLDDNTTPTPGRCKPSGSERKKNYRIIPQTSNISDYKQILK